MGHALGSAFMKLDKIITPFGCWAGGPSNAGAGVGGGGIAHAGAGLAAAGEAQGRGHGQRCWGTTAHLLR